MEQYDVDQPARGTLAPWLRMMTQRPDDTCFYWRVEIILPEPAMTALVTFCIDNFGTPSPPPAHASARFLHSADRWYMHKLDRLSPLWLEMNFRHQADVALVKLFHHG